MAVGSTVGFASLPGQHRLATIVDRLVAGERFPAAVVVIGPESLSLAAAKAITARILCTQPITGSDGVAEPCGVCEDCRLLAQGDHPDVTILPPAAQQAQLDVDLVKTEVVSQVYQSPLQGRKRVFILPDSERLHRNRAAAANALLKVLEEPASNSVLILTCAASEALLPTIRSRVQQLRLDPLPPGPRPEAPLARLRRLLDDGLQPAVIAALCDQLPTDAGTEGTTAKNQRATLERWLTTLLDDLRRDLRGGKPVRASQHCSAVLTAIYDCRRNFQPRQVLEALALQIPE